MKIKKTSIFIKVVATVLAIILFAPVNALAAAPETVMPMASAYLASYTAYICAMGEGELQIWFEVLGTGTQEYIGSLSIRLYESTDSETWNLITMYHFSNYPNMLAENTYFHMDYVSYQGVPGRYYKAYVGIWGGPADSGDSRYIWTPIEPCT